MNKMILIASSILLSVFNSIQDNGNCTDCGQQTSDSQKILVNEPGWKRQGIYTPDILINRWGHENNILYDNGKFRNWWHGAEHPDPQGLGDFGRADFGEKGSVIRLAESIDGKVWTDLGQCIPGTGKMQPFCYKDIETGIYHMFLNDIRKRVGTKSYMEYWTSKTGNIGDWVCVNDHAFSPADSYMGNMCFWREGTTWFFIYEYWASPPLRSYWYTGLASGPSLNELKIIKPVLFPDSFGGAVGGPEFKKCGDTYVGFLHSTDVPSKVYYGKSRNLQIWTELILVAVPYYPQRQDAQAADPTWIVFNNKLYLWYEDQADQDPLNPPSLTLYICDPAPEYITNGFNVTIDPVSTKIDRNHLQVTGTRPINEFVAVTCITAKVSTVTYPTSTTWECLVSDLARGNNLVAATIRNGFTSTITVLAK